MIRRRHVSTALLLVSAACPVIGVAEDAATPKKPHVVFVIGDGEYKSERTVPALAKELEDAGALRSTLCIDKNVGSDAWDPKPGQRSSDLPGLEALETADLAVFFLRFRTVPEDQAKRIQAYADSGKPLAGFRTATHAFNYAKGDPLEPMNRFGPDVLGAPWIRHYGHKSSTDVSIIPEAAGHPILKGVDKSFHVRSWLYHIKPEYPPKDATPLLVGRPVDTDKPNPEENPVAWTRKTKAGGRVFMTTMGHPEDFEVLAFRRLVTNGIRWAMDKPAAER